MAVGKHCERDRSELGADKHEFRREEPGVDLNRKCGITGHVDRFQPNPETGNVARTPAGKNIGVERQRPPPRPYPLARALNPDC